jgi:TnpA family transposase
MDDLREAINTVVNAIFRIRSPKIWRAVSTACAADSKQFGCFIKNLLTEWSPRHHNSGVMIYWHVSDQYICVYSQMKTCTSSEVASMLQGIMDQETEMEIESQYVDSHGQIELKLSGAIRSAPKLLAIKNFIFLQMIFKLKISKKSLHGPLIGNSWRNNIMK